jgi:hypothetical protein
VVDVARHADRADVHEALHALFARGVQQKARPVHVDGTVLGVGDLRGAERGRHVEHDIATLDRARHCFRLFDPPFDEMDAGRELRARALCVAREDADVHAVADERADEMGSGEAAPPCNKGTLEVHVGLRRLTMGGARCVLPELQPV